MKRMLINATQPEEIRLAMVDGQKLLNFESEQYGREQRKGNIYKAVVTRIEPSFEACFVDYGEERQGFLPFKEISRQYFPADLPIAQAKIADCIHVGQELIVQVEKEERGNKNAALTTFISLAGRYLVLMPNKPKSGGVSRRIEGEERQDLKDAMDQLEYPRGMSLIARTAGIGRAVKELQWDLSYLLALWKAIDSAAHAGSGAFLIYTESALIIRAIRDYYTSDISEILIDTGNFYAQAHKFMTHVMPDDLPKLKHYRDDTPLFARFQIEKQIESAYSRIVELPSGGSIVLDHTEALVAVDVNSARSTKGSDIEDTATNTNLEAAEEIARQLRLRDLGGLVVIDFIDMEESKNRAEVENCLRQALRHDRARIQVSSISKFGLLELSRQRLRPALLEGATITCPRCNGTGQIRDTESSSLHILRLIQEESMKDNTAAVKVQVPVDVTSFLLNKKRGEITKIETNQRVNVILVPNRLLETPNYHLERIKQDDPQLESLIDSYTTADDIKDSDAVISKSERKTNRQEPIIKDFLPDAPPPVEEKKTPAAPASTSSGGFFGWLKKLFASEPQPETQTETAKSKRTTGRSANGSNRRSNDRGSSRSRSRDGRDGGRENGRDNREGRDSNSEGRNTDTRNNERTSERNSDRRGERGGEQRTERNTERSTERVNERNNNERNGSRTEASPRRRNDRRKADDEQNQQVTAPVETDQTVELTEHQNSRPQRENRRGNRRNEQPRTEEQLPLIARENANSADQAEMSFSDTRAATTQDEAQPVKRERRERRPRTSQSRQNEQIGVDDESHVQAELAQSFEDTSNVTSGDDSSSPNDDEQGNNTRSRTRRSRDRYGRDRRQRAPRDENQGDNGESSESSANFENTQSPAMPQSLPAVEVQTPQPLHDAVNSSNQAQQQQVETSPVVAAPEEDVKQPTTLQKAVEAPVPQAAQAALSQNDLKEIAQNAGLEWVSTNPIRCAAVQEEIINAPKPKRKPRQPRQKSVSNEGPLVLVETQKIISGMRLPLDDE